MTEKNGISKPSIAKSRELVKGFQSMNEWQKELVEKYKVRSLSGKNIPEYGEYKAYFTRATLLKDFENLNYRESHLRLIFELFRNKKTNIAFPPFRDLKKYSKMSKDTLIRTIHALEKKHVFKIERRNGENNIYHFS